MLSYETYLEGLLGLDDNNPVCDRKKLFSFLKKQVGSPTLKQGSKLITEPCQNANVQNQQFQSVFTTKSPLSLSRLSTIKVQDMVDDGLFCPDSVPAGILSPIPPMEEFAISVEGIS